ncbi:chaplin family protein [Streptomyces sp. NPDC005438]|uniref:chaplin n=1 Tax=Streptomyces sp. NPDC005438 TaxID=3156880 RepID=UPI00339E5CF2
MRQVTKKGLITVAAMGGVLAAMSGDIAHADSGAQGNSEGSPGVLSGNTVQIPLDIDINACGNTVNVLALLNPTMGNECANVSESKTPPSKTPEKPKPEQPKPEQPKPEQPRPEQPKPEVDSPAPEPVAHETPQLAETGASSALSVGLPVSAGLLLGGAVLYRRGRHSTR